MISTTTASTSCITCRGWWTSARSAGSSCSKSAAASAPTWCASPGAARGSPASTSRRPRSTWHGKNFELNGVTAEELRVANGEALPYPDATFDVVYGHGVVQYTADAPQLIREMHRVLKPGGTGIFMVYNRVSWLNAMSKVTKVALEHEDAPVLKKYSIAEFKELLAPFKRSAHRPRAVSGEVTASQGLEGHRVQHDVRRHVQRAAASRWCGRLAGI